MTSALYDRILALPSDRHRVERVVLGLNWCGVEIDDGIGLCFSPVEVPRTLDWPGTLVGRSGAELAAWLLSWEPAEAAVGLSCVNACMNHRNPLLEHAQALTGSAPGHLRVFEHFAPLMLGQRVAVVGRYPGLEQLWAGLNYQCLERRPRPGDLPDSAAEYVLPASDWVFITASSIANKTLPRLLSLSRNARVVLMGPSLPWFEGWRDYGVDYLAGVQVRDPKALWQVVCEGGGTRLFDGAVDYRLLAFE